MAELFLIAYLGCIIAALIKGQGILALALVIIAVAIGGLAVGTPHEGATDHTNCNDLHRDDFERYTKYREY